MVEVFVVAKSGVDRMAAYAAIGTIRRATRHQLPQNYVQTLIALPAGTWAGKKVVPHHPRSNVGGEETVGLVTPGAQRDTHSNSSRP
jgi:hypothetical protein